MTAAEQEAINGLQEILDRHAQVEGRQKRTLAIYAALAALAHATAWWMMLDAYFDHNWHWLISSLVVGAGSVSHGLLCWRTVQALRRGKEWRARLETYLAAKLVARTA